MVDIKWNRFCKLQTSALLSLGIKNAPVHFLVNMWLLLYIDEQWCIHVTHYCFLSVAWVINYSLYQLFKYPNHILCRDPSLILQRPALSYILAWHTERNLNFPKIILFYWISTVLFYKLLLVSPFNEEQGTDILILLEILFI